MLKWSNKSRYCESDGNILYCHHPDEPSGNNWVLEIHKIMLPVGTLHFHPKHMTILKISPGNDYVL